MGESEHMREARGYRCEGGTIERERKVCSGFCLFFFFQAEDGIRDWSVTGVQTCALPIWRSDRPYGYFSAIPIGPSPRNGR